MDPYNWYKYVASLGYNTNRYASRAQNALNKGELAVLAAIITNSLPAFVPNKARGEVNRKIREILTRSMKNSLATLPPPARLRNSVPVQGTRGTTVPVIKNSPTSRWRINMNALRNRSPKVAQMVNSGNIRLKNVNAPMPIAYVQISAK
jgi:hypothetical protein